MPKIVIPDKICPHCGENEWYYSRYNPLMCYKRRQETGKRVFKKAMQNVSDWYVKSMIKQSLRLQGLNYKNVVISDKEIEIYRESILKIRKAEKIMNSKSQLKKQLTELYSVDVASIDSPDERRKVYQRRTYVKKQLKKQLTEDEYNQLIALGPEVKDVSIDIEAKKAEFIKLLSTDTSTLTQSKKKYVYNRRSKLKNELRDKLSDREYSFLISTKIEQSKQRIEKVEVVEEGLSVIDEYKRLEKRRLEIIKEVEEFNDMVEQLKLVL